MGLARILRAENPDVVHLIAMKPIVLGSAALAVSGTRPAVVHMTGLGLLGFATSALVRLSRAGSMRLIARTIRKPSSFLLVENTDDLEFLRAQGVDPGPRFAVLPGAGSTPMRSPPCPAPQRDPVAAFVGRMIRPKGVDILMSAFEQLEAQGSPLRLELYGPSDSTPMRLLRTCWRHGARRTTRAGRAARPTIREVWRSADMFVLPARGGEGMPRAMLEAAACARPLIVTDVPGCRHFVRDGVEGFVVPPNDVDGSGRGPAPAGERPRRCASAWGLQRAAACWKDSRRRTSRMSEVRVSPARARVTRP